MELDLSRHTEATDIVDDDLVSFFDLLAKYDYEDRQLVQSSLAGQPMLKSG